MQYTYDAVGNLTNITPKSASTLSVFTCTPSNGPKGMTVIIYGDGFSTTPSENTVTFSGASATVSASTVATITTTVPSAAPLGSGTVQVTNSNGSATTNFTVTSN